jgi:hypothetical protein
MAKAKQSVAKTFSDLNQLFNKQLKEPEATRPVVTMPTRIVIDEDDTSSIVIWKVMQDYRPRTLREIEQRVISIVSQQDWYDDWMFNKMNIQAIALQMTTAGSLTRTGTSREYFYTLKEGTPMPLPPQASPQKVKTVVTSTPDGREALDNGNIIVSEGLDLAIWKTFSSLKPLALEEAGELLLTVGFDRAKAKDRIIGLAKRGWFARVGSARLLKYQMKKNIKRPMADVVKSTLPASPAVTPKSAENKVVVIEPKEKNVNIPLFTEAKTMTKPHSAIQVVKADTIDQAIWKVMADYAAYTVNDIILLLQDYLSQNNYKPNYASARISFLHLEAGWFDRVRVGQAFHYTLKRSITMPADRLIRPTAIPPLSPHGITPTTSAAVQESNKAPVVEENTNSKTPTLQFKHSAFENLLDRSGKQLPNRSIGESEVRDNFSQSSFAAEPEDELKLVKLSIEIKGVPYNIKQVKEIADGLVDFKTAEVPKNSLLEVRQQFFLSGNALTPDELADLTNDLVNLGFIN